jgi:hypothetical protein
MARNGTSKARKAADFPPCLIRCRIEPGMFREEFLVYLNAIDPENPNKTVKVQLLVDRRELSNIHGTPKRHDPADGWLRATLSDRRGEWVQVILPQPSQPLGERIWVTGDSVKETSEP